MNRKLAITADHLIDFSFVFYFSMPFFIETAETVLRIFGLPSMAKAICIIITCLPVVFVLIRSKKYKIWDFFVVFAFLVFSFCVTYFVHPEYEYVYTRENYGVYPYVFRADNGLYAYLFVRLVDDPKRILKNMKISSYLMYVYFAIKIYSALQTGYWLQHGYHGETVKLTYNLSLGYDILLYMFTFLYAALKTKNLVDWVAAGVGVVMIILAGSRGPFLDIGIFSVIYIMISFKKSKKKYLYIGVGVVLIPIIMLSYTSILLWISNILEQYDISSRFIKMMLSGDVADSSTRQPIWSATINMIKENPFGYGPMGTRHVIYLLHFVGHPHQIFLEILVDWGVFAGTAFIVFILLKSAKVFLLDDIGDWKAVFLIFFCRACQLLLSLTYWHIDAFWACLAIGMSIYEYRKNQRKRMLLNGEFENHQCS